MDVTFRSKKLQKTCSNHREALKAHGPNRGKRLLQRLLELRAADNLSQIPHTPPPRCHELTGNMKGTFSVDLDHPWRLLFVPNHDPVPKLPDGGWDLSAITAVEITKIEDTH